MRVSAALQSSDEEVLKNIKRSNISYGELKTMGRETQKIDARADMELILALPGDSLQTHMKSLRDGVRSRIPTLRIHQLILLPQTEMNEPETREKFGFRTKFRLMPRSFGSYEIYGERVDVAETEEICVASNTMPFEDYLACREADLAVEILHNGNVFRELVGVCSILGVDWFDIIDGVYRNRRNRPGIAELFDSFRHDNLAGLWDSPDAVAAHVSRNMVEYLANTMGTNEMAKAKARAWSEWQAEIHSAVYEELESVLANAGNLTGNGIS